jgi:hypothetical protein
MFIIDSPFSILLKINTLLLISSKEYIFLRCISLCECLARWHSKLSFPRYKESNATRTGESRLLWLPAPADLADWYGVEEL